MLTITNPEIASWWHPNKNGDLMPENVTYGSGLTVWWECPEKHEYQAVIKSQIKNQTCLICKKLKLAKTNLMITHPEIAAQWHPTKNGTLMACNVTSGSGIKVWWKCGKEKNHEWEATVDKRTNGRECPCCNNKKVVPSNCLATTHPEIAIQWHPTKNGDMTVFDVVAGSNIKIWWKCGKETDHEWETSVNKITGGDECPCCNGNKVVLSNCLATTHPEIAAQWHPTKNGGLTAFDVTSGSGLEVWWKCVKEIDHEWKSIITSRQKNGCSCCNGKTVVLSNCLATTHPEITAQWHPTKNGILTAFDVTAGSHIRVWWKCGKEMDHEWECTVANRQKSICPCCNGKKTVLSNCLATTYPEIAAQWHPTKNGDLTAFDVVTGSNIKVWWKCGKEKNHEWKTTINHRTTRSPGASTGCPKCNESKGEKIIENYLDAEKINYYCQHRFKSCRNKKPLPFDFVVYFNNKIFTIEFHGEQHYFPVNFGSKELNAAIKNFMRIVNNDLIKEQWCATNGINIAIIPYWDVEKIPTILKNLFNNEKIEFSKPPIIVENHICLKNAIIDNIKKERYSR